MIMNISQAEYSAMVERLAPKSRLIQNCARAYLVGGIICIIGQAITDLYSFLGMGIDDARGAAAITLVFLGALFTALGLYDRIAKYAGAGTLVPITGFSNAVASPAMEFKTEGYIAGLGAKMFVIAGPVIVYGTVASVIYGAVVWLTTLF